MAKARQEQYGNSSISMLKGEDRVRKRPAVIFGSDDLEGCKHAVFEILSNAIDEAREGHGDTIIVTRYEDLSVEVEDFGRGCPVDYNEKEKRYNWELVFCEMYAGGKYGENGENYEYSLGLNGLGSCATQYASEFFDATIRRDGFRYDLHFEKGRNKGGLKKEPTDRKKTGSVFHWRPDKNVFTDINIPVEYYRDVLRRQAVVNKGVTFKFRNQVGKKFEEEEFCYADGIKQYIEEMVGDNAFTMPVFWEAERRGRDAENRPEMKLKITVSFCFSKQVSHVEYYHNSSWLEYGGSPDRAVRSGFVAAFDKYLRDNNKYTKNESKIIYQDVQDSLVLVTNCFSTIGCFENQTKKSVNSKFTQEAMTAFFKEKLQVWFIENKQEADRAAEQILINKRARESAEKTKSNIKKNLSAKVDIANRVQKFVDCRSKDTNVRELYIVEGDSALGSVKLSRDAEFQGIMPVRGKILNCLKADYNRIFASPIITDLMKVLGCGVEIQGKKAKDLSSFDIDNLRWSKVVICTDADYDGFQIRTLILTMIYRLCPTLIRDGYVYIAESPLFEITCKDKTWFAYSEPEKAKILKELDGQKLKIQRSKGLGENDPEMMWMTTMNPETRRLIKVMPEDAERTAYYFDVLLGDELQARKNFIAENGAKYLDLADFSSERFPMARKKKEPEQNKKKINTDGIMGLVGSTTEQAISETLEINYMPYAMSVIVSRAIPEIDGFKPSHRKLLYTMYKMGLLTGGRTKSANIVGQTMKLNPHGDAAIYETMVRLARGNETLLHPFVDSKGNFGKVYSRDMAYAAARYTEAKLDTICSELFRDIDLDTVDMVDNYDATMKEPCLLPASFPNVLVSANQGIAVGMASNICSFNLREVCQTTIALMNDPEHDVLETLPGPDFSTGAELLFDETTTREIYSTGRGSFKLRAKWRYVKEGNLIEIYEIPYSTATEVIMDKVAELIKVGKIKEINDMRDETDLGGLKLTIDLKRGVDPDKLMQKLFRMTPLQDSFACNFNILIAGMPRVMGIGEILEEWTAWRTDCVKRRLFYQIQKKEDRLHLLKGLERILLDIDKAIAIIRETELESEVIPNLMIGFGIDEVQANYVAEIKLRNINKEYIIKQTRAIDDLEKEIADLRDTLNSARRLKNLIIKELTAVADKYGQDRKTQIIYESQQIEPEEEEEDVPDYPVTVFISKEGYLKKITPQSLRMSGEQKFKEGDSLSFSKESNNRAELLVFTDQHQCYKTRLSDFEDGKASLLGDYLPQKLGMDPGENVLQVIFPGDYKGFIIFFFENGKAAKVPLSAYETKTNRRRLTGAFSDKSPLRTALALDADEQVAIYTTDNRAAVISTAQLLPKTTRNTIGVSVISLKKKAALSHVTLLTQSGISNVSRYRTKNIPTAGAPLKEEDSAEKQITFDV